MRINRNIVECKLLAEYQQKTGIKVLIETLWNVNTEDEEWKRHINNVLIETLWNVNFEMLQYLLRLPVY